MQAYQTKPLFQSKSVSLSFTLGEFSLFRVPFQLWVWTPHFTAESSSRSPHPVEDLNPFLRPEMVTQSGIIKGDGIAFPSYPTPAEDLPRLTTQGNYLRYIRSSYRRFIVDLGGSFEDYEKKFSSKTRTTLRKKVRKFAELSGGTIDWRVYKTSREIDEFLTIAHALSARTYQDKLLDAGLPDTPAFRSHAQELANADSVRAYLLFHDQKPVSYVFCPATEDGAVIYEYVGYDPEYRELSPGTVLQYLLLENLFAEGKFRLFDFTEGEGAHKELFSTGFIRCADIYFFRRTARNRLLVSSNVALSSLSRNIVGLLKKLGVHKRVKAMIRFSRA